MRATPWQRWSPAPVPAEARWTCSRHRPSPQHSLAPSAVEARLSDINPDALSPREALDILYH
jgi:hypothetical protein